MNANNPSRWYVWDFEPASSKDKYELDIDHDTSWFIHKLRVMVGKLNLFLQIRMRFLIFLFGNKGVMKPKNKQIHQAYGLNRRPFTLARPIW